MCLLFLVLSATLQADLRLDRYWSVNGAAAFGQDVLGSEDTRRGGVYGFSYSGPEKRLTYKGSEGQLVWSGYYMVTKGAGFEGEPVNHMHTFGVSATARYWNHMIRGVDTFLDLGWGLAYNNITTRDLDVKLVSTPFFGVGAGFDVGGQEVLTGIRWYHQSNGGTRGNNQGLNQIQYWVGVRF
jgi:hypothetical protein